MNEENQISYYAVIPATVRYDKKLKSSEKLLYGEVTALANKYGFCYAKNKYFAELYNVSNETISRWLSNLQKQGYIKIEIIKNENKEIVERDIYILDIPYCQKNQYPYCQKDQEGIDKKVKENNINNNIDEDDLFNLIINNSFKIQSTFYEILERLELKYNNQIIEIMKEDTIKMLKDIIYVLYDLYNSKFSNILSQVKREQLLNLYKISQEHLPDDLLNYYRRAIINKYTNNST